MFTEVILAPAYEEGAAEVLAAKKNIRILVVEPRARAGVEIRAIDGGMLMQHRDRADADHDRASSWQLVAGEPAAPEVLADLEFAWRAVRGVKSNAILLARDGASVGVGMGQVNRVDSCRLAVQRAGDRVARVGGRLGRLLPLRRRAGDPAGGRGDGDRAAGGSVRDDEVVAAARARGATMYFTGARHFFH